MVHSFFLALNIMHNKIQLMPFPCTLYVFRKSDVRHTLCKLQHREFPLVLYPGEGKSSLVDTKLSILSQKNHWIIHGSRRGGFRVNGAQLL